MRQERTLTVGAQRIKDRYSRYPALAKRALEIEEEFAKNEKHRHAEEMKPKMTRYPDGSIVFW